MNKLIPFLFYFVFFHIQQGNSQNELHDNELQSIGSKISSIDPDNVNFDDLAFLKQSVGNARIILLGEQTHGEGSTFNAKIRLIKFLHEKMGFNVLAFESGFYDCAKIAEAIKNGKQLKQEVTGSLFYMYATSEQMYPLFDYIQKNENGSNELKLAGFESQHSGKKAIETLFTDLFTFFDQQHITLPAAEKELIQRLSISNFKSNTFLPDEQEQNNYFAAIKQWKELLNKTVASGNTLFECSGFWLNVVASIESQALRYWKIGNSNFAGNASLRDKQMADNLIWLADNYYKNEKIIIWAHNMHIAKSTYEFQFKDTNATNYFKRLVPMGNHIKQHFGNDAYSLGFTGNKGAYMEYVSGKINNVAKAPAGTIENNLDLAGAYYFVDLSKAPATNNIWKYQKGRIFDFNETTTIWPKLFDGIFFINDVFPVVRAN